MKHVLDKLLLVLIFRIGWWSLLCAFLLLAAHRCPATYACDGESRD